MMVGGEVERRMLPEEVRVVVPEKMQTECISVVVVGILMECEDLLRCGG